MNEIITYLYKMYSINGDSYCFKCEDGDVKESGFVSDIKDYTKALLNIVKKYNRPLAPVFKVSKSEEDIISTTGFNIYQPLEEKELDRIAKELKKTLSGK